MANVKNIHLLEEILSESQREKLEAGAFQYKRHASIIFKIKNVDTAKKHIEITTVQEKNYTEKYMNMHELVEKTKTYFTQFLPEWVIYAHVTPYSPAIVNVVDAEWLIKEMDETNIRIKDIVTDTGLPKANISHWASGSRPLSQVAKAMLYFYFKNKKETRGHVTESLSA